MFSGWCFHYSSTMEAIGATSFPDDTGSQSLCPGPDTGPAGWAHLHKPIIVMVMGSLMSAAGGLLFLLQSLGVTEACHSVASACLSVGLMFVVMGLVWIPVLKEKQRRKRCYQEDA
ncbi:phosphoinositide-interacting protein-like [Sander lucioperca]|uniref:phosphoinositide-interacting protein-like n=1 Tax=Sander lucioperca TaxID=283035 RepID=UPI00165363BB|nr:phosphoinositide-interacting protein-like [Sander lucioperca]